MWNWFNCYLSGRHNFGVSCEPGAIFLRCSQCGRRSPGWAVDQKGQCAGAAPSQRTAGLREGGIALVPLPRDHAPSHQRRGRQLAPG